MEYSFYFKSDGKIIPVHSVRDSTLLEAAHKNKVELEGACEGSLACSTCHVILPKDLYKKYEEPSDKEYDLIDMAYDPTDTSRLACQIKVDNRIDGEIITIPRASRNFAVDGFKPKPH